MPPAYQIRIYDTNGDLQAVTGLETDVRSVVIEHHVNHPSTLTLGIYGLSDLVQYFVTDAIVEVRRRVPEFGIDWYTEYAGFHRTPEQQITEASNSIFTSYGRSFMDLLRRRSIRYYADTAGSAKGPGPADDLMKEFVLENAGASATVANGRLTDGVTPGLTVAADLSEAAVVEFAAAWNNLLDALRDLGEPNDVDFDVVWGGESDPLSFVFTTYYPQLGTDRREGNPDAVIFTPNFGNMFNPRHTISRTEEINSVLVLGPGESTSRDTTLRTNSYALETPWNLSELDQNASNEDRAVALEAIGDAILY
jgi:hypothetical protein